MNRNLILSSIALFIICAAPVRGFATGQTNAIIPHPKAIRIEIGELEITDRTKWTLTCSSRDHRLWRAAEWVLGSRNGEFHSGSHWTVIQVGRADLKFPRADALPKWASNPEGYRLLVTSNGLSVISSTAQGAFYGLQTLAQMLERTIDGRRCAAMEIEDWPSLRFRGAHWFPSASGVPMHLKMIQNVLAPLKLNYNVVQCEAARWEKHPGIAATNSISKADLARLVESSRAAFMEPIPLVNTPGHAEWLFRNGNNLDIAEDAKTPYAYCVRNPRSYQVVEDVLSECIELFHPSYFHVGHDEITMRGRFPNPECPRCKDAAVTDLIDENASRLSEWLGKKNLQTMIWGDMLLGPGEAADATTAKSVEDALKQRNGMPKNITIVDWHYAAKADARSLKILQRGGFKVIAATFYSPDNICNFAHAALEARAEGLLQTTWMGYFPDERAMQTELRQFAGFVLAAEYAWSGRTDPPARLGYDAKSVFKKFYDAER